MAVDLDKLGDRFNQKPENKSRLFTIVIIILAVVLLVSGVYLIYGKTGIPWFTQKNTTASNTTCVGGMCFASNKQWTLEEIQSYFKEMCPNVTVDCGECSPPPACICTPNYTLSCQGASGCPPCNCNPSYTISSTNCTSNCSTCIFDSCSLTTIREKCKATEQTITLKIFTDGIETFSNQMAWNSTDQTYYFIHDAENKTYKVEISS